MCLKCRKCCSYFCNTYINLPCLQRPNLSPSLYVRLLLSDSSVCEVSSVSLVCLVYPHLILASWLKDLLWRKRDSSLLHMVRDQVRKMGIGEWKLQQGLPLGQTKLFTVDCTWGFIYSQSYSRTQIVKIIAHVSLRGSLPLLYSEVIST